MEYISAEEFLKQPNEIKKVLIDWWKCDYGDLYILQETYNTVECDVICCNRDLECDIEGDWKYFKTISIPLLTEGQLRKFIEDKTQCKIDIENCNNFIRFYLYGY